LSAKPDEPQLEEEPLYWVMAVGLVSEMLGLKNLKMIDKV